jgi:hypothetical protein
MSTRMKKYVRDIAQWFKQEGSFSDKYYDENKLRKEKKEKNKNNNKSKNRWRHHDQIRTKRKQTWI